VTGQTADCGLRYFVSFSVASIVDDFERPNCDVSIGCPSGKTLGR
jgi:hypothetical protein